MKKAGGCLLRGCLVGGLTFIGLLVIGVALIARNASHIESGGAITSPLHAKVEITASITADASTRFAESYTIDTAATKNGNGRRNIFTPDGVTVKFLGVDDTTRGISKPITDFTISQGPGEIEIHYRFTPNSGIRTFTLYYVVGGAVRSYVDGGSVFSWTFFDKTNQLPIEEFSATVQPPSDARLGSIAFAREGTRVEELTPTGDSVQWLAGGVPASTVAEMLFEFESPELDSASTRKYPGSAIQYAESSRPVPPAPLPPPPRAMVWLPVFLAPALLGLLLLVQWLGGREYKVVAPDYERELPTRETPAEVAWLMRYGKTEVEDITATLLDLARRGFLRIEEQAPVGVPEIVLVPTRRQAEGPLHPHESQLLNWVFPGVGVTWMSGLNAAVKANPSLWQGFWPRFKASVADLANSKGLMETGRGGAMQVLLRVFGGLTMVGSAVVGALTALTWVLVVAAGAILVVFAGSVRRRSKIGAQTWARWDAFRRYLHDFSMLSDVPPAGVVLWEEYLAYAIPLGEGDTVVHYMRLRPPAAGRDWYPADPAFVSIMSTGFASTMASGTPSSSVGGGGMGGGGGFGGGGGASFD